MKQSTFLFAQIFALFLFLCSCTSMRVNTSIVKQYPALEQNEPVEVYFHNQDIPIDSEALGLVKALDHGLSIKCDSLTVVEHLKTEARKIGGNAVAVTKHIKPSIWGSSCHQMLGTIIRVHDFDSVIPEEALLSGETVEQKTQYIVKPERQLPRFTLAADFGYGWRTAPLSPDLDSFERAYWKGLKSGLAYNASFKYYFNDYYGLGLGYSAYNANQNMHTNIGGIAGDLKANDWIYFVGPVFSTRLPLAEKWTLEMALGAGYLAYVSKWDFRGWREQRDGATFGVHFTLGVDYQLEKNWALGFRIASTNGVLTSMNVEDSDGYRGTIKADSPRNGEGLGQLHLLVGLRYYIR